MHPKHFLDNILENLPPTKLEINNMKRNKRRQQTQQMQENLKSQLPDDTLGEPDFTTNMRGGMTNDELMGPRENIETSLNKFLELPLKNRNTKYTHDDIKLDFEFKQELDTVPKDR